MFPFFITDIVDLCFLSPSVPSPHPHCISLFMGLSLLLIFPGNHFCFFFSFVVFSFSGLFISSLTFIVPFFVLKLGFYFTVHFFKLLRWELVASLVAQMIKNPPAIQETQFQSLGWGDLLEKGIATHSSVHAWRIPWTEEGGGLQSMGL